jgi:hypothetical protein
LQQVMNTWIFEWYESTISKAYLHSALDDVRVYGWVLNGREVVWEER